MKQNKDRKKNIYQKFHWKLTLFATVVTGCILVGATLLCLSLSERELERNQYISFLNNVNTTLSHMEIRQSSATSGCPVWKPAVSL